MTFFVNVVILGLHSAKCSDSGPTFIYVFFRKSRQITRTNLTNFPKNGLVGRMAQDCVDKIERKSFLVVHFLKKILDIYVVSYAWSLKY